LFKEVAVPLDDEVARTPPAGVHTPESCFFWMASADGWLRILRCERCGHWTHPPLPRCPDCGTYPLEPTPVSGYGQIVETAESAAAAAASRQHVRATVELDEQPGLHVTARVVAADPSRLQLGMRVVLRPEEDGSLSTKLPVFALDEP
jgi:uncharacterized OB-fold protein